MSYQWRVYLHGLFAAVLGSLGNSVTMAIVDPNDFNPMVSSDWKKLLALIVASSVIGFFTYIKTHPLPDPKKDSDADVVVQQKMDALASRVGN